MKSSRFADRNSAAIRLRTILNDEFARRRKANPRYSLRAFARSVAIEHSTLSQLLRGKRALTWKAIRQIAGTMRWTGTGLLNLWSSEPRIVSSGRFDSRLLARRLGKSVDDINVALTDLCLFRLVELKENN